MIIKTCNCHGSQLMQFKGLKYFFFLNIGLLHYIAIETIHFYYILITEDKKSKFQVLVSNCQPKPIYKKESLTSESVYGTTKEGKLKLWIIYREAEK